MGMYPRKGALAVRSVDIVGLDTGLQKTVPAADLHETDYTPWEAHVVTAWPSVTVQRGEVMVEGERFYGDPGDGQFLPRRVADETRARPAVWKGSCRCPTTSLITRPICAYRGPMHDIIKRARCSWASGHARVRPWRAVI